MSESPPSDPPSSDGPSVETETAVDEAETAVDATDAAEPEVASDAVDATVAAPSPQFDELPSEVLVAFEPASPLIAVAAAQTAGSTSPHGARRKRRRTWPQRFLLALNCLVILACFAGAIGLLISRHYGNSLVRVDINTAAAAPDGGPPVTDESGATIVPDESPSASGPVETFPDVDPEAKNFLITGADNNACIDPSSPYAPAFGNRESMGERSDTIMLMRVDPSTQRAAVLSFPRDLWVSIGGSNKKGRINEAYVRDDPAKLIETIGENFYLGVDHFIQIDFCAFKTIVDGLGGVSVPFDFPARDSNTGLNVPTVGCFNFDGDHALAYVRSRKYQYRTESGEWKTDPVGDLGRISRQQDFLRRVLSAALDRGVTDPGVARSLIKAAQENVVVDTGLTITRMLEFVGVLRNFDPGSIATYQIESEGTKIGGNSVQLPRIKGDNMQAILDIFRGSAPLAGAPAQVFETTTSTDPDAPTTVATTTSIGTSTTVEEAPTATVLGPEENVLGIVPPEDISC